MSTETKEKQIELSPDEIQALENKRINDAIRTECAGEIDKVLKKF